jgi:hypothetical protein
MELTQEKELLNEVTNSVDDDDVMTTTIKTKKTV